MSIQFNFEWDPAKAKENLKKHKVSFETGVTVFRDPQALTLFDGQHSDDEDRWVTFGRSPQGEYFVVVHTFDEMNSHEVRIRMISARRASRREREQYEANR